MTNKAHRTPGGEEPQAAAGTVRGVAVAANDLQLRVETPELPAGRRGELAFSVLDRSGAVVREFEETHERRMHLIVVRRDLSGFQHLHPEQRADGSWATSATLSEPGSYRVFADFSRGGEAVTLAGDLRVDGRADLRALPEPQSVAVSDGGYDVRLDAGKVRAGAEAELAFTVTRDGVPVQTEPYLGAGGHLVGLREGDLAFLHVHPSDHGDEHGGGAAEHDDAVRFAATFPTAGRYRLFLQFKLGGRVETVAFTQEVAR